MRHADTVALPTDWSEITRSHQRVLRLPILANERQHAVVPVVAIDPFEPAWVIVEHSQRRHATVDLIQIPDNALDALMIDVIEQMPVEALVVAPSLDWPKSPPMKSVFLPGQSHISA